VPHARRRSPGAPKGKANGNYKTGRFTCEAIERRRQFAAWIRQMAQLAGEIT
jgi:hypothetical protein